MSWVAALCLSVPLALGIFLGALLLGDAIRLSRWANRPLVDAFEDVARRIAKEMRYRSKVMAGLVHVKEEPEVPEPEEWLAWSAAHPEIEEAEKIHLRWAWDVARGTEKVTPEKRLEAFNLIRAADEAGYDMPPVPLPAVNPGAATGR